jgi:hypothetical protein
MAGNRTLKLSILADVDDLNKKLKAANSDVETSSNKLANFGKVAAAAFAAAAVAAGTFAVKVGIDAVKAASDLSETVSKVGVLFGDTAKKIEKFAEGAATSLGQTKQQALDAAATFATFGKAAGLTGDALANFSTDFVTLASDLASFNNTSPEQAINAIGSALRGEAEPLRAYGVLLDDASLRQKALELGIVSTTKNALTPQQKVLAAQKLIFEQTGAAQGDFARTSDGLANKTRILTASLENAKATIGQALLPIVLQLATFISKNVLPIVERFSASFNDPTSGLNQSMLQVSDTLKKIFIPIWNGLVSAFNSVRGAVKDNLSGFKQLGGYISEYLAPVIGTVLGGAFNIVGKIASGVITVVGGVVKAINAVIGTAIDGINALIKAYNAIPLLPNIPTVSKPTLTSPNVSTPSMPKVSTSLPSIPSISTTTSTGSSGSGGGSKVSAGGVSTAAKSVASVSAFPFGTSGVNTNTLAGIMAASGPTYNINVTGALDKEGVARQIVEIINDSGARGTGGVGAFQAV